MMTTPAKVTTPKSKPQSSVSGDVNGGSGVSAAGTPFVYTANPSNTNLSLVASNPTPNYPNPNTDNTNTNAGVEVGAESNLLTTASSPIRANTATNTTANTTATAVTTPEHHKQRPISASHVDISTDLSESGRVFSSGGGVGGPGGKRISKRVQPNLGAENSADFV